MEINNKVNLYNILYEKRTVKKLYNDANSMCQKIKSPGFKTENIVMPQQYL